MIGVHETDATLQPDIEEIREVSVYVDTCQKAGGMVFFILEHMF